MHQAKVTTFGQPSEKAFAGPRSEELAASSPQACAAQGGWAGSTGSPSVAR